MALAFREKQILSLIIFLLLFAAFPIRPGIWTAAV